jgi:hypothetical protein
MCLELLIVSLDVSRIIDCITIHYVVVWYLYHPLLYFTGYIDLSLSDQVHLIECCWMELLLLNCTFRSMSYNGKRLVFAPDLSIAHVLWLRQTLYTSSKKLQSTKWQMF